MLWFASSLQQGSKRDRQMQEIEIVFKTYGDVTDVHVIAGDSGLAAKTLPDPSEGRFIVCFGPSLPMKATSYQDL